MHCIAKPTLCKSLKRSQKVSQGSGYPESSWTDCHSWTRWWWAQKRWGKVISVISQVWYIHVQVLQYEETAGIWSEIGKMKKARVYHGVVEIEVNRFCSGIVGQMSDKSDQIVITHLHHHHYCLPPHHLFIISLFFIQVVSLLATFYHKWYLNDFKVHTLHSSFRYISLDLWTIWMKICEQKNCHYDLHFHHHSLFHHHNICHHHDLICF